MKNIFKPNNAYEISNWLTKYLEQKLSFGARTEILTMNYKQKIKEKDCSYKVDVQF